MRLTVEKYRSVLHPFDYMPEPITVIFNRYDTECLVSAIMEFLEHNFEIASPPKYRDSDGDMVLLETREDYEAALGDVLPLYDRLVVHVDGIYKYEEPEKKKVPSKIVLRKTKNAAAEVPKAESKPSCSYESCFHDDRFKSLLREWIRMETQKEVAEQIHRNPHIIKLKKKEEKERQNEPEKLYRIHESTQTCEMDISHAVAGSSLATSLGGQTSSKEDVLEVVRQKKDEDRDFQLVEESPVWDVKAIYEKKTIPSWERFSSFEVMKSIRDGEGIFSKRWVLRRAARKSWDNVLVINELISGTLEIYRSKMTVTNLPEQGQIIDFTVWVKCSPFTEYAFAMWRLYKMADDGKHMIPEGPRLNFEIMWLPSNNKNYFVLRHISKSAFPSSYEGDDDGAHASLTNEDIYELEECTSTESVSASDFEVIDTGENKEYAADEPVA